METQKQLIEKHLLEKGKITSWEAFEIYGITRLSHIIYVLRRKYDIISVSTTKKNRYGHYCTYSTYTLKND
jgi:hypothetical protein|nr:MAG TPA: helix-turn-helix domain protein [Caudoviricetes sp.]